MSQQPTIGFAGMTHLGLNSAVAVAERGFACYCYDANEQLISELRLAKMPVTEPSLAELWQRNQAKLTASADPASLANCDIVYISTDVPTDNAGNSDLAAIEILIGNVIRYLNKRALLVILCQVPPGFTRRINYPQDQLFYQVETLIFGKAVERAMYPERYMIGCADPSKALPAKFQQLLSAFACPILPMQYESAELAKISINCCLVASVSVANTLAEICETIGADWSEIVPALKLDKRIGQYAYLAPGLGISGGNLERDLATVLSISHQQGTEAGVISAFVQNSNYRKDWVLRTLHRNVLCRFPQATIAVLGVAYKADTDSIKNSPAINLLTQLTAYTQSISSCDAAAAQTSSGAYNIVCEQRVEPVTKSQFEKRMVYQVKAFDPVVPASVVDRAVPRVEYSHSIQAAAAQAHVLVIMTPWQQFKNINLAELAVIMTEKIIIDPLQVLARAECIQQGFAYHTLGCNY